MLRTWITLDCPESRAEGLLHLLRNDLGGDPWEDTPSGWRTNPPTRTGIVLRLDYFEVTVGDCPDLPAWEFGLSGRDDVLARGAELLIQSAPSTAPQPHRHAQLTRLAKKCAHLVHLLHREAANPEASLASRPSPSTCRAASWPACCSLWTTNTDSDSQNPPGLAGAVRSHVFSTRCT